MTFFKHPCSASFWKTVMKLEQDYNLAGIGLLWKLSEKLCLNQGQVPLSEVFNWSCRGLRKVEMMQIMNNAEYDFFLIDENQTVRPSASWAKVLGLARTEAGTEAGAETGTEAGTPDPAHTGHHSSNRGEKKRKRKERKSNCTDEPCIPLPMIELSEEEREFQEKMRQSYPHVSLMRQPLTSIQMQRLLDDGFAASLIAETLRDMENRPNIESRYSSAYLTLRKWMRMGRY